MLIQKINICLISFFSLYELFPVFIWANHIESLINSFSIPVSVFCLLSFTFSEIVSCGRNCIDNDANDGNFFFDGDPGFDVNRFIGVLGGDNGLFFSI